jgi:hypothetical protein
MHCLCSKTIAFVPIHSVKVPKNKLGNVSRVSAGEGDAQQLVVTNSG